ncbi:MAG: 30S ribosomal protein S4e [Candidatus ainarchaeum sp.]|nr:30S ribosomal protein S4e [Candidatus ainarchaeum sp.]
MAKKGRTYHTKRIAISKAIPVSDKKAHTFMVGTNPGPHPKSMAIPLGVLLREVLGVTMTAAENRKVLNSRSVLVDGKARREPKFPVGLMDIVSFPKVNKSYRIIVNKKSQLIPLEIKHSSVKIGKVVGKHTVRGGKLTITLHDGRNIIADNNVRVGDSVIISVPDQKITKMLKFEPGARCLVMEGPHAGIIANLGELIKREGSPQEAKLKGAEEFVTVAKYLFVVDESYEG